MTKTSLCYMLGNGSKAKDWELRYSLRSFMAHMPEHLENIWIVGHLPKWLVRNAPGPVPLHYVPFPDPYRHNKDANLIQKMIWMAMEPGITERFILSSDDQLLLKDSTPDDFRPLHNGNVGAGGDGGTSWRERLRHTATSLKNSGKGTLNYDAHIPYPVEKGHVREVLKYDYGNGGGMTIFTLLFNAAGVEGERLDADRWRGAIHSDDMKPSTVKSKLSVNRFCSFSDGALRNATFMTEIERMFPTRQPWEDKPDVIPAFRCPVCMVVYDHETLARKCCEDKKMEEEQEA